MSEHPNCDEYFNKAITDLIDSKCKIVLDPNKTITYSDELSQIGGYFLYKPKELGCAVGSEHHQWYPVFLHEYQHFKQFIEKSPLFMRDIDEFASEKFDNIIGGSKNYSKKEIKYYLKIVQDLEIDCEKRVVEVIKNNNLEIDISDYIKKANAYIFLYNYIMKHKAWPNKRSPYTVKKLVAMMPPFFLKNYSKMPDNYEELVTRYCYKK